MTATVAVGSPAADRVARLPLSALFNQGAGPAVWVIDVDGRPALRPVSVAAYEAREVLVASGLREGDRVVTLGVQKLDPGPARPGRAGIPVLDRTEARPVKRFNLSAWAVHHPALVIFLILAIGVAGYLSFQRLGRAEDPNFTIKNVIVTASWPGATAREMQDQVADRIEKRLQELPWFDKVITYTKPGFTAMNVGFRDNTPAREVPQLFYQLRKKLDDLKRELPGDLIGAERQRRVRRRRFGSPDDVGRCRPRPRHAGPD